VNFLEGKRILLISPQPWDHVFISKHHYAEELAKKNNQVYFLQPPRTSGLPGYKISQLETAQNIHLISWRPFFPRIIRFHFKRLYRLLISWQARWLRHRAGCNFDVVWSFEFNLYPDLTVFGPAFRVFHPVDPLSNELQINVSESADLILSVSQKILGNFSSSRFAGKTHMVGHGLSSEFEQLAMCEEVEVSEKGAYLKAGYFGNLDRRIIDINLWERLISQFADVQFNFWGPYTMGEEFERRIGQFENVTLHGKKDKQKLIEEISRIDVFLLLYKQDDTESDLSNSHKILEYLSTGKALVSVPIDECMNVQHLINMPTDKKSEIDEIFQETIQNIKAYNRPELSFARKQHARKYRYNDNLSKIDQLIADSLMAVEKQAAGRL
jgi:hypothetical protein